MNNIEWKDGAVCFAHGKQWYLDDSESEFMLSSENRDHSASLAWVLSHNKFQLNEPRQGDYLPKSELDIEQRYNNAVDAFGLFGFKFKVNTSDFTGFKYILGGDGNLTINDEGFIANHDNTSLRELAYNQLMAIGKLKRLMNESDNLKRWGEYSRCVQVDLGDVKAKEVAMQKNKPVVAQVMIDLTERMEIGIKTYGEALRANNGRDALQDAYEEALDLACYLKQAMIERDNANTN